MTSPTFPHSFMQRLKFLNGANPRQGQQLLAISMFYTPRGLAITLGYTKTSRVKYHVVVEK